MEPQPTADLVRSIVGDVRTIARDEVELVRIELASVARHAAIEAAAMLFGAIVALIGFTLLCVAAVVALAPVIPSLAIRLVIMAVVFGGLGALLAIGFGMKLRRDAVPNLSVPIHEAKTALEGAKEAFAQKGRFHA